MYLVERVVWRQSGRQSKIVGYVDTRPEALAVVEKLRSEQTEGSVADYEVTPVNRLQVS